MALSSNGGSKQPISLGKSTSGGSHQQHELWRQYLEKQRYAPWHGAGAS
jgi:hypothetical protein